MLQKQIHQLHLLRTVDKTLISKIYLQWIYIYQKMKKKLQASIVFTQASNIIIARVHEQALVCWLKSLQVWHNDITVIMVKIQVSDLIITISNI